MKVLVACEESQVVTKAFRALGHEAYSCDLVPCSGGHPEWHIQDDCINIIKNGGWDFIGFHPDCTAMVVSGNRWYGIGMKYHPKRIQAVDWTIRAWRLIKKTAKYAYLENPVSVIFSHPEMTNHQYIHPWQFGHGETKKTGLELHNLPFLVPTNIVDGREQRVWKMGPSKDRKKLRSKTFSGIGDAFAEQWGKAAIHGRIKKATHNSEYMLRPSGH